MGVWAKVVFPTANLGCYGYPMGACLSVHIGAGGVDKLEHQSSVKNKLTSPSSIIILRCSMAFGHTLADIHTFTHKHTYMYIL